MKKTANEIVKERYDHVKNTLSPLLNELSVIKLDNSQYGINWYDIEMEDEPKFREKLREKAEVSFSATLEDLEVFSLVFHIKDDKIESYSYSFNNMDCFMEVKISESKELLAETTKVTRFIGQFEQDIKYLLKIQEFILKAYQSAYEIK